jgi:hypothetical protein
LKGKSTGHRIQQQRFDTFRHFSSDVVASKLPLAQQKAGALIPRQN